MAEAKKVKERDKRASVKKAHARSLRKREINRYNHKMVRAYIRTLRSLKDKTEAEKLLPKVISKLDKLAKRNTIHKNKASNLQSKLTKFVNQMV